MSEIIRPENYISDIQHHDINLDKNIIYLMAIDRGIEDYDYGVDFNLANRFIKNIDITRTENPKKPLTIMMNTNGGDWDMGMAIYDTIKCYPWHVTILNCSHARSMSSIIMQAADKKLTMPSGFFMFHDGTFGVDGTVKQVESAVEWNKKATEIMIDIYINSMAEAKFLKNGSERKRWVKSRMDKKEDVYLTAQEAVDAGFFHAIFDGNWDTIHTPFKYKHKKSLAS